METLIREAVTALEEEAQGHFEREARYAEERDRGGRATANRRAKELQGLAERLKAGRS